jgi:DNA-binding GntR family transcriptional regulator
MLGRGEGLTALYNRFHTPAENDADIAGLRAQHQAMDQAVAAAYGWADLDLGHGFHESNGEIRYTISEAARREVLRRLLALNYARHAAEQQSGGRKAGRGKKPRTFTPPPSGQMGF